MMKGFHISIYLIIYIYKALKLEQCSIMFCIKIMFFILFIPHVFSLKVLSFEKLNFERKWTNFSSFALKFEIEEVRKETFTC